MYLFCVCLWVVCVACTQCVISKFLIKHTNTGIMLQATPMLLVVGFVGLVHIILQATPMLLVVGFVGLVHIILQATPMLLVVGFVGLVHIILQATPMLLVVGFVGLVHIQYICVRVMKYSNSSFDLLRSCSFPFRICNTLCASLAATVVVNTTLSRLNGICIV